MAAKNETWLILVILVIAGVLIALSFTKSKPQELPASVAVSQERVIKPDHSVEDMKKIAAVKPSAAMVEQPKTTVVKAAFAVQVFSFKDKLRADAALKQLKDKGYEIINPDTIRVELTGDMADQSQNAKVWRLTHERLVELLKGGRNAVLDATNVNLSNRRKFMNAIKEEVPNVVFKAIQVNVDKDEAIRRVQKRVSEGGLDIPTDVMDRMYNNLQLNPPKEDEGFQTIEII